MKRTNKSGTYKRKENKKRKVIPSDNQREAKRLTNPKTYGLPKKQDWEKLEPK